MNYLNAGCGTHYAEGWINCDVWEDELTRPDVRVTPGQPYPFDDESIDALFLGHVLEHMPWPDVFPFMEDMLRICKQDAPILIVGPDVLRTIELWAQGRQPEHMVLSVMEHQDQNYQPGREGKVWDGAPHHWNCHEERVGKILKHVGMDWVSFTSVIPHDPTGKGWHDYATGITWPVVGYHEWQFAIMTKKP